jgi:aspartyl-tRNA(Asn)/glutamyl-tRNA(Gln) amidotransferase subunit A
MVLRLLLCEVVPVPESASMRLERVFEQIHATEPLVNAYVHIDEKGARAAAEFADSKTSVGPLHGMPFAVKEVIKVADIPAAGGTHGVISYVPCEDATVVERLRAAGAVLVGTQVSHELTCGLDEPPTRNPWNLECYPGGSSAGAGASAAIGSASFALGTDAAGSVRIPAAMTGVVGMKPSAGLVSRLGVIREASAPSIDNVGIVARNVGDVGSVLAAIAGPDSGDGSTLHGTASVDFEPSMAREDIDGVRIAVLDKHTRAAISELWPLDSEVESAFGKACEVLVDAGVTLVPIELPSLASATNAVVTFFSTELAFAHRKIINDKSEYYHPDVLQMLRQALATPPSDIINAVQFRDILRAEVFGAFRTAEVEFLVTPTTPRVAMPLSTFEPTDELGSLIPYTCGFNLTGQPAISVPCGFTAGKLPIGLQFVGLPFQDVNVLEIALAYERRTSWHRMRPPIAQ